MDRGAPRELCVVVFVVEECVFMWVYDENGDLHVCQEDERLRERGTA